MAKETPEERGRRKQNERTRAWRKKADRLELKAERKARKRGRR